MSIQKIIQESINGNPLEMKEALVEELRNRIALVIEAKMNDDDSSEEDEEDEDDDDMKKEEVEQIDELNKSTLGSYIKKATANAVGRTAAAGVAYTKGDKDFAKDNNRKLGNRVKGIYKASDKLAKESVELGEASDVTMKQLQKKFNDGTHEAMNDPKPGYHVELRNTKTGKRSMHYVKEETESFDLSDYTVEELEDFIMSEDFEQLDELEKKTLASYVKKASGNIGSLGMQIGRKEADADEVDRMTNRHMPDKFNTRDTMKKALGADSGSISKVRNKAGNRIQGIERASDRLAK